VTNECYGRPSQIGLVNAAMAPNVSEGPIPVPPAEPSAIGWRTSARTNAAISGLVSQVTVPAPSAGRAGPRRRG
jgi:hypothetical protein